jgi:hypothetical protein
MILGLMQFWTESCVVKSKFHYVWSWLPCEAGDYKPRGYTINGLDNWGGISPLTIEGSMEKLYSSVMML